MKNPDPKRFKLKKLRGGDYVLVSVQILRWRKSRKQKMASPEKPRNRSLKRARIEKQEAIRTKAYKMFE